MTLIKTGDLIIKFQYALDNKWGYILNTWHTKWSQALQNSKVNYMENKYGSNWKTFTECLSHCWMPIRLFG